jgi:hypothetical protein
MLLPGRCLHPACSYHVPWTCCCSACSHLSLHPYFLLQRSSDGSSLLPAPLAVCTCHSCAASLPSLQAQLFAPLDHAEMGLWEALQQLGELREYEAALLADAGQAGQLDPDMPLLEHAFQTAEICR